MKVNAYKTEHCGDYENTYSVEIDYDPANEAERVEAQMTIIPYRPMLDFGMSAPEIKGGRQPGETDVDFGMRLLRELFDMMGSKKTEDEDGRKETVETV